MIRRQRWSFPIVASMKAEREVLFMIYDETVAVRRRRLVVVVLYGSLYGTVQQTLSKAVSVT